MYSVGYILSATVIGCFHLWLALFVYKDYLIKTLLNDLVPSEFDYIVVGAGTAGSIVAARLAQDPNVRVLLIEAGGYPPPFLDVPLIAPLLQLSGYDWHYRTVPQEKACKGLNQKSSNWPMGKVVGGSGALNYAMYIRGHKKDYDYWGDRGNDGWHYNDVLPYFRRAEEQRGINIKDSQYHSIFGRLPVEDLKFASTFAKAFLEAGKELGYLVRDLNQEEATGFMLTQTTTDHGRKCSTARAYISQCSRNLQVITNAIATKILFRMKYEANAVTYVQSKQNFTVKARRGIVLSAGTIGSAKLLMLSGIGPKKHLEENMIDVLQDLPVGNNLQDHIATAPDLLVLNTSLLLSPLDIVSPSAAWAYFINGKGPLSTPGCEALALLQTRALGSSTDWPDIQLMAMPMGVSSDGGIHMKRALNINETLWAEYFSQLQGQQVASIMPVLLHPKSKGNVHLKSRNPLDPPSINPLYLSSPDDIKVLYEGIRIVQRLINTTPMQNLGVKMYRKPLPACSIFEFDSEAYWYCYIEHITLTSYHPVGTCSMGQPTDSSSVVSAQLRVHNTNHLYVIDASVMPSLPSGNINAAVTMIAEKGSDIIKNYAYNEIAKSNRIDIFIPKKSTDWIFRVK
ncbi:glucose dehydrogenase [FAD, quinone]-like [Schistocerca gregaria]|uniref:glucose dehydrogenase [FAD, quinone]-like n=1 Tax=Schistocerca gregaria TaxID=7010 RepID=UPI00211E55BD|nr:glucose dehydrogenase [FAD, quinone]-like [Schistocerca gregaria]